MNLNELISQFLIEHGIKNVAAWYIRDGGTWHQKRPANRPSVYAINIIPYVVLHIDFKDIRSSGSVAFQIHDIFIGCAKEDGLILSARRATFGLEGNNNNISEYTSPWIDYKFDIHHPDVLDDLLNKIKELYSLRNSVQRREINSEIVS